MQYDFPVIDPQVMNGSELAAALNGWAPAVETQHAGNARPVYAAPGTLWIDTAAAPQWSLKCYTGPAEVTVAKFDANTGAIVSVPPADGTLAAPAYSFAPALGTGMLRNADGSIGFSIAGAEQFRMAAGMALAPAVLSIGLGGDALLRREGANSVSLRNGVNAQTFSVFNTFTDAGNYEVGTLKWNGNTLALMTGQLGAGIARPLQLGTLGAANLTLVTNNVGRFQVQQDGHMVCVADNAYNIGAAGANRPANVHVAASIVVAGVAVTAPASRFTVGAPAAPYTFQNAHGACYVSVGGTPAGEGRPATDGDMYYQV